jgi:hypothetical protein
MKMNIFYIRNTLWLLFLLLFVHLPQAMGSDDHPDDAAGVGEEDRIIVNGTTAQGSFEIEDDLDFFSFSALSGYSFEIVTGGNIDTYLALYDTDGNTVITVNDDLSESGFLSRIDWTCDISGTYYVMVRHSEFQPKIGEYSVRITGYGDLAIVIRTMQGLSGLISPTSLTLYGEVNDDQRIGLEEVIFMLQKISGFR